MSAEEHGIGYDGFMQEDLGTEINHLPIFRENSIGQWTPRSIFIDCEPDQIESLVYSDGVGELIEPN